MLLQGAQAVEALGRELSARVEVGDVIALSGDLGAGKTTLARGLLAGLGLAGEAPSPTFTLVQTYEPPDVRLPVWHVDLYRLDDPDEAAELGLDEARDNGILVIEWPERLGEDLPADALWLRLEGAGTDSRCLTARVPAAWEERWPPA